MVRRELCLPLALLFLSTGLASNAQKTAAASGPDVAEERVVRVAAGAPLLLECALRVEQRAEWRLDGRAVPADLRPAPESAPAGGWLTARLRAPVARGVHAGVYTCAPPDAPRRQRVRVLLLSSAGTAPTAATDASAEPVTAAALGEPDLYFDRSFELNCTNPSQEKDTYSWTKNDTALSSLPELRHELLEGGAVLRVKPAHEQDYGRYVCSAGAGGHVRAWTVWGRPHAKLPANTNVVEGQKLKLVCKVTGKPTPAVEWRFNNGSDGGWERLVAGAREGRVSLEDADAVANSVLLLADAQRSDAGEYSCVAGTEGVAATTTLRVKDMYAALWPFLGICAEVFVLCAIILVYEKRRTKPELDDSDTDNHEQ